MAISKIDSDGIVSGGITADSLNIGQIGGRRNRIINGNMMIDQRNSAGSPITSGGRAYAVDRWSCEKVGEGAFTFGQSSTAPTGFKYSLLATVTTADTSIAPTNIYWFEHRIEGYNINDLEFGTANAKTITLSFWVRSSLTGTYSVCVASTGSKTFEYTINSADTWEYKTIQITGPTATYSPSSLTSGTGINFRFALAVSSNYAQAASSDWTGSDIIGSTNQVNWMNTVGNTFYLTGVQLEVGTVATPFEHRSYGEELLACCRYYWKVTQPQTSNNESICMGTYYSGTQINGHTPFKVPMRSSPTLEVSNGSNHFVAFRDGASDFFDTFNPGETTENGGDFSINSGVSGTAGHGATICTGSISASFAWKAEL